MCQRVSGHVPSTCLQARVMCLLYVMSLMCQCQCLCVAKSWECPPFSPATYLSPAATAGELCDLAVSPSSVFKEEEEGRVLCLSWSRLGLVLAVGAAGMAGSAADSPTTVGV